MQERTWRRSGSPAHIVEGDAEVLPFAEATFDRVTSNGVLHHTPDMPAALREIHRVLKPQGETRVIVYNRASFHYWLTQVMFKGVLRGGLLRERSMAGVLASEVEYSSIGARPLVKVYTRRKLKTMLEDAGLRNIEVHARHFRFEDTPITYPLRKSALARRARLLDRMGRAGGWYLVARAWKL